MAKQDVIVIGAGMAGLAAARELYAASLQVKLIEARRRVGGRTWTDRTLGIPIDLGGAWMHGTVNNPVTPLAEQFNAGMALTDFRNELGQRIGVFDQDGAPVDPALLSESRRQLENILNQEQATANLEDISIERLIRQSTVNGPSAHPLQQRLFDFYAYSRLQLLEGADIGTLSWRRSPDYIELEGGDQLLLNGYNSITDGLAQGLTVETGLAVREITYDATGVQVVTDKGVETAERVVITVPLGVLQSGAISFSPELPPEKQAAIHRLGMGLFEKLALKFPRRFWPEDKHVFFYLAEQQGQFPAWLNLAAYHATPVLVAHHAGSPARMINRLTDMTLIAEALSVLRKMFGSDIPEPEAYVRTGWGNDPFSRGSYSFQKLGCRKDDRQLLAAPVAARLFFAGEATHPKYFGTVHGAYSSGVRAAQEILHFYAKQ
jgi:monoamine oxidase